MTVSNNSNWWRGAVIYQVYPRSYLDSTGTGVGDLKGITSKLEYIASLGVDAVWISPFFTSPMKDFGYDISDYCDVDPIFGCLADFDVLIEKAHSLNLKIMIDLVLSHCSDEHKWFKESRLSDNNDKADWFVWADANDDGSVPNNWQSVFGGAAWTWDSRRKQYYLHNFLTSQPDLNFHNPEVQQASLDTAEFWLKRGVDGFRLDAVNFYFHDQRLRNNPPRVEVTEGAIGVRPDNPYGFQMHKYDKSQPQNVRFLEKFRSLLDQYPGSATVGEIGCDHSIETMAAYTSGNNKLNMAYSFDLLTEEKGAPFLKGTILRHQEKLLDGWPCWSTGNHDVQRVMTRWADKGTVEKQTDYDANNQKDIERGLAYLASTTLARGSVCLYQGEELGFTEAKLTYEDLVDPYGLTFWPEYQGRDGCRTPMAWTTDQPNGGFSTAKPWLPVASSHIKNSVEALELQPEAILHHYRDILNWRKQHEVLLDGDMEFIDGPEDVLFFVRKNDKQTLLCAINLSNKEQTIDATHYECQLMAIPKSFALLETGKNTLAPWQVKVCQL
ncbi:alpha-glucosidase [Marinicellulosiphila megalodicopiae]|uniref:alpha-glucosidase n=1 Tax=Marinicellulosiphila megalodicopiae TaxID=2724896 RepID=UPI003BAE6A12